MTVDKVLGYLCAAADEHNNVAGTLTLALLQAFELIAAVAALIHISDKYCHRNMYA